MLAVCPLTSSTSSSAARSGAVALALVGVCVIGTFGVTMVMSQEYLPRRIGMASGLSIGLSIGLGGIAAVGLGAVADSVDLQTAMYAAAAAAVPGFVLATLLPVDARRAGGSRPSRLCRLAAMDDPREFFDTLESRVDPAKAAGMNASYLLRHRGLRQLDGRRRRRHGQGHRERRRRRLR